MRLGGLELIEWTAELKIFCQQGNQGVELVRTKAPANSIAKSRFIALLLSSFAGLALVLGIVGVYGVLSYAVSQQRREIGIRMALGAMRERIIRSIVMRSMTPVALGVALGLGGAVLGSKGLSSLLYNVKGTDPLVLGGAAFVLMLTALLANYIPAWRATRVDAVEALRSD